MGRNCGDVLRVLLRTWTRSSETSSITTVACVSPGSTSVVKTAARGVLWASAAAGRTRTAKSAARRAFTGIMSAGLKSRLQGEGGRGQRRAVEREANLPRAAHAGGGHRRPGHGQREAHGASHLRLRLHHGGASLVGMAGGRHELDLYTGLA